MPKTSPHLVLVVRNAAPTDFGGAEIYPVNLAKVISQERGFDAAVVSRSSRLLTFAQQQGVKTIRGWWWSRQNWSGKYIVLLPLYAVWLCLLVSWYIVLLLRTRAQTLHLQSKDDFIAGTVAARLLGKHAVWTDHMDLRFIFQNINKPLRNPTGKLVYWAAYLAHSIILISDNEYRLVTSHFPAGSKLAKRLVVINNGVLDRGSAKPASLLSGVFSFCLASRVVAHKGIGEAISAFESLQQRLAGKKNLRLDIYGDGPDMRHFQEQAANIANVTFYGHQNNAIDKIRESCVFILPSYLEGFSIALLEATMLGKAIIATNVDSNSEIIHDGKTGLLVSARDAHALEAAMLRLIDDSELLHRLESGARKNYIENYNLATIATKRIVPIYVSAKHT